MLAYVIYPNWQRLSEQGLYVPAGGGLVDPEFYEVIIHIEVAEATIGDVLGVLFEQFNIGDHGGVPCRSMSLGDIVVANCAAYLCKPVGWEELKRDHWIAELIEGYEIASMMKDYEAKLAEAKKQYPGACESCGGTGMHYIAGSYDCPPDSDACSDCLGEGRCPRCGKNIETSERDLCDYYKCECGYDEQNDCDPVLPSHPLS